MFCSQFDTNLAPIPWTIKDLLLILCRESLLHLAFKISYLKIFILKNDLQLN